MSGPCACSWVSVSAGRAMLMMTALSAATPPSWSRPVPRSTTPLARHTARSKMLLMNALNQLCALGRELHLIACGGDYAGCQVVHRDAAAAELAGAVEHPVLLSGLGRAIDQLGGTGPQLLGVADCEHPTPSRAGLPTVPDTVLHHDGAGLRGGACVASPGRRPRSRSPTGPGAYPGLSDAARRPGMGHVGRSRGGYPAD